MVLLHDKYRKEKNVLICMIFYYYSGALVPEQKYKLFQFKRWTTLKRTYSTVYVNYWTLYIVLKNRNNLLYCLRVWWDYNGWKIRVGKSTETFLRNPKLLMINTIFLVPSLSSYFFSYLSRACGFFSIWKYNV